MKPYKYTEGGLDNIYLMNGYSVRNTPYGESVSIDNLDGLHKAIARHLVENKPKLSGAEFRFLRIEMDMSQKQLGKLIGVSSQTIALWEKHKVGVKPYGDILVRIIYREWVGGNAQMKKLIDHLNSIDRKENKIIFQETQGEWVPKAA
ncbi:MAG: helix-turn-helix domain-containing protein [Nitrospinae bacterium]|nr:helix-turn-helix domain-containing protein [Nitrospinota bacterium]